LQWIAALFSFCTLVLIGCLCAWLTSINPDAFARFDYDYFFLNYFSFGVAICPILTITIHLVALTTIKIDGRLRFLKHSMRSRPMRNTAAHPSSSPARTATRTSLSCCCGPGLTRTRLERRVPLLSTSPVRKATTTSWSCFCGPGLTRTGLRMKAVPRPSTSPATTVTRKLSSCCCGPGLTRTRLWRMAAHPYLPQLTKATETSLNCSGLTRTRLRRMAAHPFTSPVRSVTRTWSSCCCGMGLMRTRLRRMAARPSMSPAIGRRFAAT
jgi:hypothetical protein